MATPNQILANRHNAIHSTGPATPQGKAVVSQNAAKLGLYSKRDFVPLAMVESHRHLSDTLLQQLDPAPGLEELFAREIISASWRLELCAIHEAELQNKPNPEPLQLSIDRARASATRILWRSLSELKKLLKERQAPVEAHTETKPLTIPTKQTQIPRSAPCPCGSGEKYKRCCGTDAPPILFPGALLSQLSQ